MKAVVFNLGCKVNQYESNEIAQALRQKGFEVSAELGCADIYIINTCAVTAEAERKSRQAVKRCLAHNPEGKVFVCGCAAQHNAAAFESKKVEYVCGMDKSRLLELIEKSIDSGEFVPPSTAKTRALIKVQDGCDNFCSYCIIPHLRGRSQSRDIPEIVEEIKALAQTNKEIVITGINLALFGKDNATSLARLIAAIKDIDVRIRLGSFYVEGLTEELLTALFSLKEFCPHFHLSLQSGDDTVLKAMNRRYTAAQYLEKVNLIRNFDKNAAITTDIIVGFPTETQQQFENTVEFVKQAGFSDIHIFPFSAREGTAAAKLPPLPKETVRRRAEELAKVKRYLQKSYLRANIGIAQKVLFEEQTNGIKSGYSERYIRVYAKTQKELAEIVPTEIYKDGLKGEENG